MKISSESAIGFSESKGRPLPAQLTKGCSTLPGTLRRRQIPLEVLPADSRTGSGATTSSPWPGLHKGTNIFTRKMKRFVVKGKPRSGNQGIRLVTGSERTCTNPPDTSRGRAVPSCCQHSGKQLRRRGKNKKNQRISGDQPSGNPGCNRRREPAAGSDVTTAPPNKLC